MPPARGKIGGVIAGTAVPGADDGMDPATAAEQRLLAAWSGDVEVHFCAPDGEPCVVVDPAEAAQWGDDRAIRGAFLRSLLVSPGRVLGVGLHGARIEGTLDLSWLTVDYPLDLVACAFDEPIVARSLTVAGLDLSRSHLPGLDAMGLETRGRLVLDGVVTTGPVRLRECRLGGSLSCRSATLDGASTNDPPEDREAALDLYLARVEGGVYLTGGFAATGQVRLLGATIGGPLTCQAGTFTNPDGRALSADQARIAGSVFLTDRFAATGEVRLHGATIGGQLNCRAGSFANPNDDALSAEGADVTGHVLLDRVEVTGAVHLWGATVHGGFSARAGRLDNPGGLAVDLRNARVEGVVQFGAALEVLGTVTLAGARLEQHLLVACSLDAGWEVYALHLERAQVGTTLDLAPMRCRGIVDLTDAAAGTLRDRKDNWPARLRLEGFTYRHVEAAGSTARDRLDWLRHHVGANGSPAFSPRPYEQLAAVYRAAGDAKAARTVGIAARREYRRRQLSWRGWDLLRRAWNVSSMPRSRTATGPGRP